MLFIKMLLVNYEFYTDCKNIDVFMRKELFFSKNKYENFLEDLN